MRLLQTYGSRAEEEQTLDVARFGRSSPGRRTPASGSTRPPPTTSHLRGEPVSYSGTPGSTNWRSEPVSSGSRPCSASDRSGGVKSSPLTCAEAKEQISRHHLRNVSDRPIQHPVDQQGGHAVDGGPRGQCQICRRFL